MTLSTDLTTLTTAAASTGVPPAPPAASAGSTRLFPHFLFRATGFPFEPLERLGCSWTLELAEELLEEEAAATRRAEAFLGRVREAVREGRAGGALSAASRRVRRRRPVETELLGRLAAEGHAEEAALLADRDRLLAAAAETRAAAAAAFAAATERAQRALAGQIADERYREAVLLSSPGALDGLERAAFGDKPRRQAESKALLYLQRFCAKNDTISFFGPVSWGRFAPAAAESLDLAWNGGGLSGRHVFFEHWMVDRLARAAEADPRLGPELAWRVVYPYEWDAAGGLLWCDLVMSGRRERPLDALARELLGGLADGPRRAAVAGAAARSGRPEAEADAAFARLAADGVVRALEVGIEALDPLADLAAALRAAAPPGAARRRWERRLAVLAALGARLAGAGFAERRRLARRIEARFTAWTGDRARRSGGRTYAGRNLFYEECTRHPERFVVGGALAADLEADLREVVGVLSALMEVVAPYGWRKLEEIHRELAAGGGPVLLSRFLRTLWRRIGGGYLDARLVAAEDEEELLRQAEQVLAFAEEGDGWRVAARDGAAAERVDLAAKPVVLGVDLMLSAADVGAVRRGDYELVVGEIQYFPLGYPEYLWNFHPEREEFRRDYRRCMVEPRADGARLARLELEPEATRLVRLGEPLADYVLVDGRGRPTAPDRPHRRITELTVELTAGRLELVDRGGERFVLANPHFDLFLDTAWKLLVALYRRRTAAAAAAGRTPCELRAGRRTVLLRRTWTLAAEEVAEACAGGADGWRREPFAGYLAMQRLRRRRGLPRHVFARVPGEVKPVHVDFASPLSCAGLVRMARPEQPLVFSEMRPGPDRLWLRGEGGRHTSEMRVFLA